MAEAATTWVIVADYRKNSKVLGTTVRLTYDQSTKGVKGCTADSLVDPRYPHRSSPLCLRHRPLKSRTHGLLVQITKWQARTCAPNGRQKGRAGRQRQWKLHHRCAVLVGLDEKTR